MLDDLLFCLSLFGSFRVSECQYLQYTREDFPISRLHKLIFHSRKNEANNFDISFSRMFGVGCVYGRNDDRRFGFFCHSALEFILQNGSSPVSVIWNNSGHIGFVSL
jgi:hypothetical protein